MASFDESDQDLTSAPTTPSSLYTDAEEEQSLLGALEEGHFELALQLISLNDCSIPVRLGRDQLTPLHFACQHGRLDVIEDLVKNHLYDLNILHMELPTPLHIAAESGHSDIVKYLLENLPNFSFKFMNVNPFHVAAEHGQVDIMKCFLSFDSTLALVADQEGNTPLHYACCQNHLSTVVLLTNEANHPLHPRNKKGETPLHLAIKHSHLEIITFLVEEKSCNLGLKDYAHGSTPFHVATKVGILEIVQYLANEKECDLECKTSPPKSSKSKRVGVFGRTPLHYASYGGHCDVVAYLVAEKCCNPSCVDDMGFTPLHLACQEGHIEVVQYLLSLNNVDPNQVVTGEGITLIHSASLGGNLEIMKLLLDENYGDSSSIDSEGRTALHYSSRKGHTTIVKYLLEDESTNPNPNCVDESHVTPLHLAAQYGHLETVKFLISEAAANANLTEENGYTPLHLAANKGRLPVVEFLVVKRYSNIVVRDKTGRTPLHHACQSGHLGVVKYLSSQPDSDLTSQEKNLKATPLHLAASFGHLDVVRHLVDEKGLSPICSDKFNSTPVHRAAASGHCDVMNYFIREKQCSSVLKNKFGNTPLHLACQKGKVKMVELLLSFSTENMMARNQVGRMPLDLTEKVDILSIFLRNGIDPSKGNISTKFPYLKFWEALNITTKIFLLGDLATGKSTLAKTLRGGGFFQEWVTGRFQRVTPPDGETCGIIPINFDSRHFGRVLLYDFSGHPSYHPSHSVILSAASSNSSPIYLITVDLCKSPDSIESSVTYWSSLLNSVLGDQEEVPHVILIGTHEDEMSKEGLRQKPVLLEKLVASSSESGLPLHDWIALDCRKQNSASIHKLRQLISQRCETIQCGTRLDHNSCLLRSFILYKFQGTIVIEFTELLEYLSHTNIPDIKDKQSLFQACQSLHSWGYLLLLETKESIESSWIIHNQEAILSMVHSFHKMVEISNPLGLVSISQLQTSLATIGFNVSLAIRYLLRMKFCMKVADRRVLYSVSGFEPPHPLEDHLFFPHLVRSSAPLDLWNSSQSSAEKLFGWYAECVEKQRMLGPRFLQLVMLHIAACFPFNTNPNSPFSARKSSCVIWRKGLFWTDVKGFDALIEVQKKHTAVMFATRIRNDCKSEFDFYNFRSSVINEIRSVIKEACPHIQVVESLIHPSSLLSKEFLSGSLESNPTLFHLPRLLAVLRDPDLPDTVTAEQVLLGDHVIQVIVDTTMSMKDLLQFEPFMGLPKLVLDKMFTIGDHDVPIDKESYDSISEALSKSTGWNSKSLTILLRIPSSSVGIQSGCGDGRETDDFKAIFQRWAARKEGGRTYGELGQLLGKYSVLCV